VLSKPSADSFAVGRRQKQQSKSNCVLFRRIPVKVSVLIAHHLMCGGALRGQTA
jgi:hypothetical protein